MSVLRCAIWDGLLTCCSCWTWSAMRRLRVISWPWLVRIQRVSSWTRHKWWRVSARLLLRESLYNINPIIRLCPFQLVGGHKEYTKPLPALALRNEVEKKVLRSPVTIIQGATGSVKSTQLPAYLASLHSGHDKWSRKVVACTQPWKLAATGLADRVNHEFSGGDERSISCSREEGVLLNELLSKPRPGSTSTISSRLRQYDAIVIDEAHERSINTDLLLGLTKAAILNRYSDMPKVVVTSATLENKKNKNKK